MEYEDEWFEDDMDDLEADETEFADNEDDPEDEAPTLFERIAAWKR
jgi:hypothetical protein